MWSSTHQNRSMKRDMMYAVHMKTIVYPPLVCDISFTNRLGVANSSLRSRLQEMKQRYHTADREE